MSAPLLPIIIICKKNSHESCSCQSSQKQSLCCPILFPGGIGLFPQTRVIKFIRQQYRQTLQLKHQQTNMNCPLTIQPLSASQAKTSDDNDVAGFVFKTFELLGIEEYQKIVYWSSNGLQFVIKDVMKFEEIVLPRYFRHKKMNSFVRQLNMYGFHKMKHNNFKSTFRHEFFQKDRQDLLTLIRRKPKLNDKQNEDTPDEPKMVTPLKVERVVSSALMKQEEPTMAHEKWNNLSQEFLQTTKMINMSLIKVSCNELNDMVNQIPEEDDDCVSIEDAMQEQDNRRGEDLVGYQFEDPACFFASKFDM